MKKKLRMLSKNEILLQNTNKCIIMSNWGKKLQVVILFEWNYTDDLKLITNKTLIIDTGSGKSFNGIGVFLLEYKLGDGYWISQQFQPLPQDKHQILFTTCKSFDITTHDNTILYTMWFKYGGGIQTEKYRLPEKWHFDIYTSLYLSCWVEHCCLANMHFALDPNSSVIKRLWSTFLIIFIIY